MRRQRFRRPGPYAPRQEHQQAARFPTQPYRNDRSCYAGVQCDAQVQRLRTLQASQQMLYDVYEHTMGMIEELEKYEPEIPGKTAKNSGLLSHIIPIETKLPWHEVETKIDTELSCLQAQMMFAQDEAKESARKEMLITTIGWLAAREEKDIPIGPVDQYARNVYQILKGEPMDSPEAKHRPTIELDERVVNELLFNYGQARHQGDRQDRAFHDNPEKKAAMRKMRQGERGENGIERLKKVEKDALR